MATIDIISRRLTTHQAALATTGVDPTWDKALHAYLRADVLQQADLEIGAYAGANEVLLRRRWALETKYGKGWRQHPAAGNECHELDAMSKVMDDAWVRDFCAPFWRVSRELALTPSPTMAAAIFKASMIEADDLANDSEFPANAMEVLQADFARLAGEA
ncbi:hypothetical protein EKN06_12385 [Croceicoccus ponticola]|uniref:Uncharacterized protein n=1 Tax=Croceicoccus ponticola TaxID=2217664 RepID=A0A437GVB6_9SPHN|nr:hypothetical protein [Croceicoccus ponticola]RVQ65726.1 hypothetical protein EKN06_12385 [Croceicoccus ponticola]